MSVDSDRPLVESELKFFESGTHPGTVIKCDVSYSIYNILTQFDYQSQSLPYSLNVTANMSRQRTVSVRRDLPEGT